MMDSTPALRGHSLPEHPVQTSTREVTSCRGAGTSVLGVTWPPTPWTKTAATALGAALAVVAVSPRLLGRERPLHSRGRVHHATLEVHNPWPGSGIAFLEESGSRRVLIRVSRAVGLPQPWPDISGLAVQLDDGVLLFASTATGPLSRRVLLPRGLARSPMTTLLPLHCAVGTVDLLVRPRAGGFELHTSLDNGRWIARAHLHEHHHEPTSAGERAHRYDPLTPPAGLSWSPFWAWVRRPAYRWAQPPASTLPPASIPSATSTRNTP